MHQALVRGSVALAAVAALGSVAACGSSQNDAGGTQNEAAGAQNDAAGSSNDAVCRKVSSDLQVAVKNMDPRNPDKVFSDTATKIRADAQDGSGDVQSAAEAIASDYDKLAQSMSSHTQPDMNALGNDAKKLGTACGTSIYVPSS